jgi:hypothetical protein
MNRNNYPINEPIFPHWNNLGVEKDNEFDRDMPYEDNWKARRDMQDLITQDWARWRFMEFKIATYTDEKKKCEWCIKKFQDQHMEPIQIDIELIRFRKGEPVIREQVSVQNFKTLHIECAREKIQSLKDNIDKSIEKMELMSRMLS